MKFQRMLLALATAIGMAIGGLAVATPAQALQLHDGCYLDDACLFYRINYQGAVTGIYDEVDDYFDPVRITFLGANNANNPGSTDGRGKAVGNATGSYFNADDFWSLRVYEHRCVGAESGWGRSDLWHPQTGSGNGGFTTRNNNRCQHWE